MNIRHRRDLWKLITVQGNAAEIGVAEGYFSADILGWPTDFPKVYMVDRWTFNPEQKGDGGHPQEWHNMNRAFAFARVVKFGSRAVIFQGDSVKMSKRVPDKSLSFLSIDADHSFDGVMNDLVAWVPKVMSMGIVTLHDYESPEYGVKTALKAFALERDLTIHLLPEDKPCDAGAYFYVDPVC